MASDVEKLVAKWRAEADEVPVSNRNDETRGYNNALYDLADELEAALRATQPVASGEVAPERCSDCRHTTFEKRHDGSHICVHCKTIATPQPDADTVRDASRAEAIRRCAISYLGMLGVKNPEQALDEDIRDPDMCGDAAIDSAIKGEK